MKGGGKWGLGTPCPPPQSSETRVNKYVGKQIGSKCYVYEGLDGGGVWYSLFIKTLAHYSSH